MRRQSARARKIATTADIAVSSIINHSSEPLPKSGSTPKTISIQSGHSAVAKKSNMLSIASPTSSRSRHLETLLARCDGGMVKPDPLVLERVSDRQSDCECCRWVEGDADCRALHENSLILREFSGKNHFC